MTPGGTGVGRSGRGRDSLSVGTRQQTLGTREERGIPPAETTEEVMSDLSDDEFFSRIPSAGAGGASGTRRRMMRKAKSYTTAISTSSVQFDDVI